MYLTSLFRVSIPPSLKDQGLRPTTSGGEIKAFGESAEGIDVVIYDSPGGHWRELFNSDASDFGGSGMGNMGKVTATRNQWGLFRTFRNNHRATARCAVLL